RRTRAAADHRRDARHHRLFDLLRADEMNVRVDAAGRRDQTLSCDDLGTRADHDIDARLHVRIAALADADDAAVLQADVGLDDTPVIEDQGIRDDRIDDLRGTPLPLPHAVADHLAAAELHFLAVDRVIAFDLDDELGIAEPHAISRRRPEHLGIGLSRDRGHVVTLSGCQASDRASNTRALQFPHDLAAKAVHDAIAGICNELHLALLPGLESHGGP